jgi:hydroxymethylglutaryl-CoA lyase
MTALQLPKQVTIMDVSPRDGLQSEPVFVPTEKKVALIEALLRAGLQRIELTSFASPKWVPQMADAEAVLQAVAPRYPEIQFEVLLPNLKGYERAVATGLIQRIGYVVAATETLNTKNVNMSVADSMQQFGAIAEKAKAASLRVRGTIGVAFVCPYEGRVAMEQAARLADEYFQLGADEVCLADTVGRARPDHVYELFARVKDEWPDKPLAGHFHDTQQLALANIFAALQAGADIFDSSVGNLGGCQFAAGATGNVATERVVYMLNGMGITTGIDEAQLRPAADFARSLIVPPLAHGS